MEIYIDRTTGKGTSSQSPLIYTVAVEDNFVLEKTIQIQEGEKQKVNDKGQLLYKDNVVVKEDGTETYDEVTTTQKPTKFEEKDETITTIDENGKESTQTIQVQVPVEFQDLEPVMIPNMINKIITLANNPEEFTINEIVNAKYKDILEASACDHILADLFLNEEDIDLADVNHSANTGIAIMQLLPGGQAKTKEINLTAAAKTFTLLEFNTDDGVDIYLNDVKLTENHVTLEATTDRCAIKFVNTTDKPRTVKSYAIGY